MAARVNFNLSFEDAQVLQTLVAAKSDEYLSTHDMNIITDLREWVKFDRIQLDIANAIASIETN